jgi:hypothetical protein
MINKLFLFLGLTICIFPITLNAQGLVLQKEFIILKDAVYGYQYMQIPFIKQRQMCGGTGQPTGSLNNADNSTFYDFENDGIPEILFYQIGYGNNGTKIQIYDGSTYLLKYTIVLDSLSLSYSGNDAGASLAFFDVDGDGVREMVGEFQYTSSTGSYIYSRLLIIDVKAGKVKYFLQGQGTGYPDGYEGWAYYDIDHDSYPEILCRWHSDVTGELKLRIYGNGSTGNHITSPSLAKTVMKAPVNFPNPFTGSTRIEYYVPNPENILLNVFNSEGQVVRTLLNKKQNMGEYSILWDGKNESGTVLAAGQYYYQLKIGNFISTKKMISLK